MTILVGEKDNFNMALAKRLDIQLIPVTTRYFKDQEICPRIHTSKESIERVIYCARKTPEEDPNVYFNRFLFTAAGLKKAGAEVTAVMPYLVYARQDKDFVGGDQFEPKSIDILLETMSLYVDELITFNVHFQREQGIINNYSLPIHNIDGFDVFDKELSKTENMVIIAPDDGMRNFAEKLSKKHQVDFDFMLKSRNKDDGSLIFAEKDYSHIKDQVVVIPDDMYSTCGTMVSICNILRKYNPNKICTMAIHGAFTQDAHKRLGEVADRILVTDTINSENFTHSVLGKLANYLRTNLFN